LFLADSIIHFTGLAIDLPPASLSFGGMHAVGII